MNYLFYDESQQLVASESKVWQVDGENDWSTIGTDSNSIEVHQNGFVLVYLSNVSGGTPIYFDNLNVSVENGVLLEERHYYSYGLPIKSLESIALSGKLKERGRYQGNEYIEELGLNWMDFHARQYDPQLGRFMGIDPMAVFGGQAALSPYHAMGCDPVNRIDPLGTQSSDINGMRRAGESSVAPPIIGGWLGTPNSYLHAMYGNLSNPTSSALFSDFSFSIRDGGLFEMAGGRSDVTVINLTDYQSLRRTDRSFGKKRNQEDVLQDFTDFKECYGDQVPEEVLMLYASKGGTILGSSSYELFFDYDRFYKNIRNAGQSSGGEIDYPSRANYLYSLSGVGINASAPLLLGEWSTRNAYGVSWYNMSRAEQVAVHSSSSQLGYKAFGNTARFIGKSSFVVGVAIDGYGVATGKTSWGKFGVNTGVGLWGFTGVGTIPALVYFGTEAYYPGGFIQLLNDSGRWHDDTKRILGPGWRPVPFGPK